LNVADVSAHAAVVAIPDLNNFFTLIFGCTKVGETWGSHYQSLVRGNRAEAGHCFRIGICMADVGNRTCMPVTARWSFAQVWARRKMHADFSRSRIVSLRAARP
jgi:hypothetical protein